MKRWTVLLLLLLLGGVGYTGSVVAGTDQTPNLDFDGPHKKSVERELVILRFHPVISKLLAGAKIPDEVPPAHENPLSDYETPVPRATQPKITAFEKSLLKAYLNSPNDVQLAKYLAIYHLSKEVQSGLHSRKKGNALYHRIIAQYFLSRARDLGENDRWIRHAIEKTQRKLDALFKKGTVITLDEDRPAHLYFRETFHKNEGNRFLATESLLDEFVEDPRSVYTAFALTAVNLWIGGEANYADPTVLYNFAVGGYFSLHAIELAKELETAWDQDPSRNTRFRMASILGGFSLLQRRWFAKLHDDYQAVQLVDAEHRQWRDVQRAFHAFTLGLPFFEEPEHVLEGLMSFNDAILHCQQEPIRSCSDMPRFPYNFLGFMAAYADFFMKINQPEVAAQVLSLRFMPPRSESFQTWDIGRPSFLHRENNVPAITALYQNGDPNDDPLNFFMKRRKWGMNTTTCQVCHQTQSKVQTKEEMDAIQMPPESVASVRVWPKFLTTWYGAPVAP
jgi:hypothetical protein